MIQVNMMLSHPKILSSQLFRTRLSDEAHFRNLDEVVYTYGFEKTTHLNVIMVDASQNYIDKVLRHNKPILLLCHKSFKELNIEEKRTFTNILCTNYCVAVWVYDDFEQSTKKYIDFLKETLDYPIEYREMRNTFSFETSIYEMDGDSYSFSFVDVKSENQANLNRTLDHLSSKFGFKFVEYDPTGPIDRGGDIIISVDPQINTDKALVFATEGVFFRSPQIKEDINLLPFSDSRFTFPYSSVSYFDRHIPLSDNDYLIAEDFLKECQTVYASFGSIPVLGSKKPVNQELQHNIFHFIMRRELHK